MYTYPGQYIWRAQVWSRVRSKWDHGSSRVGACTRLICIPGVQLGVVSILFRNHQSMGEVGKEMKAWLCPGRNSSTETSQTKKQESKKKQKQKRKNTRNKKQFVTKFNQTEPNQTTPSLRCWGFLLQAGVVPFSPARSVRVPARKESQRPPAEPFRQCCYLHQLLRGRMRSGPKE